MVRAEEMDEDFVRSKDLLNTEDVAGYLGVSPVTIWRWCRDGSLPCLKVGRSWHIRRSSLGDFLEVPDNVLAVARDRESMYRLDVAFFRARESGSGEVVLDSVPQMVTKEMLGEPLRGHFLGRVVVRGMRSTGADKSAS